MQYMKIEVLTKSNEVINNNLLTNSLKSITGYIEEDIEIEFFTHDSDEIYQELEKMFNRFFDLKITTQSNTHDIFDCYIDSLENGGISLTAEGKPRIIKCVISNRESFSRYANI